MGQDGCCLLYTSLEEEYEQLMEVYAKNKVEIVCSLPYYRAAEMDKVRGEGSFDKAIEVIKHLNAIGYGRNPELVLNMVYNPAGAFFPQMCIRDSPSSVFSPERRTLI